MIWLFLVSLMQLYNEKEQVRYKELKDIPFEEKKSTRKPNILAEACVFSHEVSETC